MNKLVNCKSKSCYQRADIRPIWIDTGIRGTNLTKFIQREYTHELQIHEQKLVPQKFVKFNKIMM